MTDAGVACCACGEVTPPCTTCATNAAVTISGAVVNAPGFGDSAASIVHP